MPGFADRLEADVRREGEHSAAEARARWERDRWPLDELDRLRGRARHGRLRGRAGAPPRDPVRRPLPAHRHRPERPELEEARAFADGAEGARRAARRARRDGPPIPRSVLRVMEQLEVHVGETPQPDRVQVAAPGEIRARRFEAVFCCGLQEGEFPRGASPEPFLSDDDRRAIATASGLVLPVREDRLDRERYLFYVCASRAERLLVLSSRSSDEEGNPQTESFFVDDVRDLLADGAERRTRSLSEVTWPPEDAPTAAEWDRAHAAHRPAPPGAAAPSRSAPSRCSTSCPRREAVAARALENFADCPVKWLVEDLLRPEELVPDPEAMVRGSYAHEVLEPHLRAAARGDRQPPRDPRATSPTPSASCSRSCATRAPTFQLSPKQTRVRAAARRLEFDLLRFLRSEADSDARFEPAELERDFGMGESEPVELDGGLRVRGRIDRVDECDGMALVIDYKTGKRVDRYKVASWEPENRFQAALYMLVVEKLLGPARRPAACTWRSAATTRARAGMVAERRGRARATAGSTPTGCAPDEFQEKLDWALGRIRETDARMRAGELRACPDRCDWNGGCTYPSICRSER